MKYGCMQSDSKHKDEAGQPMSADTDWRRYYSRWIFPLLGFVSLIWFLIRVISKPSRATYPCMRAAYPMATGFVIWLTGICASAFAYHKWKTAILQRRWVAASLCAMVVLGMGIAAVNQIPFIAGAQSADTQSSDPNNPIGVAKGIFPGRVVWVHDPDATNWDGFSSAQHYFDDQCTDMQVCEKMMSLAIRGVAGKTNDDEAWDAVFRYFNLSRGNGDRGYQLGEKIMIKVNFTTCNAGGSWLNTDTWDKGNSYKNYVDTSPQMIKALLRQLVYTVGVRQSDITVGDTTAYWPNCYLDVLIGEFPDVKYLQNGYIAGPGRTGAAFSNTKTYWSTDDADGKLQDYIPLSYIQAAYFINFANLKGHSSGITLCGKNNYGSLIRCPDGYLEGYGMRDYYDWHLSLPNPGWSPGMGHYRAIVDMMGNPQLGGKTLLYLIDGLFGGYYWEGRPYKWNSAPFSGDWPSSLFASQDPVAIDSVGYDFLLNEWPSVVKYGGYAAPGLEGGAEDYLHEAAMADNPASGTFYDPDRNGVRMASLGVHEHWNNPDDKQYSRNLAAGDGIELVTYSDITGKVELQDFAGSLQGVPVSVQLLVGDDTVRTESIVLDSTGGFCISDVISGRYNVAVKPLHFLRRLVSDVGVISVNIDLGILQMINGDSDNDNEITSTDLSVVLGAMDSTPGSWNWVSDADLDSDSEVTSPDLSIVLGNMDMLGQ